jgi:2-polyprenyl-3-methyl-5-hydroxy-6-metoxy-1,4-benzoquinol methylase
MTSDEYFLHNCDLCGSNNAAKIEVANVYTNNQPLHVCKDCGFVYVKARRSANRIAEVWSEELYGPTYTARIPAVKARQTYVAGFIDDSIGFKGKSVCDIGGGEGQFLKMIMDPEYGANVYTVEPSKDNCGLMSSDGIENFCGSVEDFIESDESKTRKFDIVTIMWTVEASQSCRTMIDAAYDILKDDGYLAISTGSRLLVPFKKPLNYYLGPRAADTHPIRFSENSLTGLFAESGFERTHINRFIDTDYLVAIGKKTDRSKRIGWPKDNWRDIVDFFNRWHKETQDHYLSA